MTEADRFEGLLRTLEDLVAASDESVILVEGRRDQESLQALGCRGPVLALNQGDPLFTVCERVAAMGAPVILLTDWDRRGGILFAQVTTGLQANGCRVDGTFRDRIRSGATGDLKDVEGLAGYVERGLARFRRITLEDHVLSLAPARAGAAESF